MYAKLPRPPNRHPSESRTWRLQSSTDIAPTRDMLDDWLQTNASTLDDLQTYEIVLATSELLCNAFEHGSGDRLFTMKRRGDVLLVTVSNQFQGDLPTAGHATEPDMWAMPSAESHTGRGLAIVKSVAETVEVVAADHEFAVTATFNLVPRTRAPTADVATLAM